MNNYDDILSLPRPQLKCHIPASRETRAAQFGAFRALNGYEEVIEETGRFTEQEITLTESSIEILNHKINELLKSGEEAQITYFKKDEKKDGGEFVTLTTSIKKKIEEDGLLLLQNGLKIEAGSIVDIKLNFPLP